MNSHKNLQDFVANARRGDTHTTVREDMKRVETYTAADDEAIRENRRAVILTTTITVANMYETKQTTGDVILDAASIPGEVLDGVTGTTPSLVKDIQSLTAPFAVDDLMAEHQRHLPAL